jgi:hypothetical protein
LNTTSTINDKAFTKIKDFIVDYCQRHAHPINAILHIIGVPAVFFGLFKLFTGFFLPGLFFFVFGYLLQYLGHQAQGNEVGEITLLKHCYKKIFKK